MHKLCPCPPSNLYIHISVYTPSIGRSLSEEVLLFTLPLDVGLELDWLAICDSFVVLGIVNGFRKDYCECTVNKMYMKYLIKSFKRLLMNYEFAKESNL